MADNFANQIFFRPDDLKFEKLNQSGLSTLLSWAEIEGWNPGIDDIETFWATDPNGFYADIDPGFQVSTYMRIRIHWLIFFISFLRDKKFKK